MAYTAGAVAQQAGFSLSEIRELLESSEEGQVSERLKALAQSASCPRSRS
jgi:DNA-binding transcriptional MerR regulator